MNSRHIETILQSGSFPHPFNHRKLVETHISYVILGTSFAYKFKKEIQYSFLDFTTLEKRKYFCIRELQLNNRLSQGVYLDVVNVRQQKSEIVIDGSQGRIIDYAVKMKRLKEAKQMHLMLQQNQVTPSHIKALADLVKRFHLKTEVIHKPFEENAFASRFNDILSVTTFLKAALGAKQASIIQQVVQISDRFLRKHKELFRQRVKDGFIRDCHGDLHARNIFLYAKPIVFDCLEFNDDFRQMDILDELAFFCMDLEAEGFHDLSKVFTDYYFSEEKDTFGKTEHNLFTYYKCYRANVRAKVNALRAMKAEDPTRRKNLKDVSRYLTLMNRYANALT